MPKLACLEGMPGRLADAAKIPRVNTYDISTDPGRLDLEAIHAFLVRSDGAPGIPEDLVARAITHALSRPAWLGAAAPPA
jgi:hypothetical protein